MEKISILIPTYNRINFLPRSINSILNQTHQNIELIIYDDGSSDGTLEFCEQLRITNTKIRFITCGKNKGVGYARNRLLEACNTKYAIWMDSDDISAPDRIELQLKEMTEDKMVYCTWENLKKKTPGTTRGFATLLFPVNKDVLFPEDMLFGGEDQCWRDEMEKVYPTADVDQVLYSIDFHGDRIGTNKRKIDKEWGGAYDLKDLKGLSYEECINKYKKEH